MAGYWKNPDARVDAATVGCTPETWVLRCAGSLTLRDRSKDVVSSGGSNIYPREVEEVLIGHPAFRGGAVGAPDQEWARSSSCSSRGLGVGGRTGRGTPERIARQATEGLRVHRRDSKNSNGKVLKGAREARLVPLGRPSIRAGSGLDGGRSAETWIDWNLQGP
jgi:long-chain acyl-CoA synthetase